MHQLEEKTFAANSCEFHYATIGPDRPALVFLHGVTRCWQDWMPLISAFGLHWRIFACDLRGHGHSCRVSHHYRVVDYLPDVVTFLREVVRQPAVVYGHSMGAMIAAAAAVEAPEQFRALILEDPPFDTMGRRIRESPLHSYFAGLRGFAGSKLPVSELADQLAEMQIITPGQDGYTLLGDLRDPTALQFTARCLRQVDPSVLDPIVEGCWLEDYDRDAICKQVKCPTLLMQADCTAGGMLTDDDARQVKQVMDHCLHVKLPDTGHQIHWLNFSQTIRLVMGFVESLVDD